MISLSPYAARRGRCWGMSGISATPIIIFLFFRANQHFVKHFFLPKTLNLPTISQTIKLIMKPIQLAIFLCLLSFPVFAQIAHTPPKSPVPYSSIDKKALQLPDSLSSTTQQIASYITANFATDSDKARAIFIWVASNIQYDIDNMFAINFYEKKEEKIAKALRTKKGICENYAALFNDVCQKSGLSSYVIIGYTKQNGFADYIPHAWCAAQINGTWFLFDPTWGSGYASNGKFVKKINNAYYKVPPSRLIKSHIPFDPMWEFLNYPVTNQEFYEGKVQENRSKAYFSYSDSIAAYEKLSEVEKDAAAARRIEGNGIKNALVFNQLQNLKRSIEIYNSEKKVSNNNAKVDLYNSAVADYNEGANNFKDFIDYRNNQFKPTRPDAEIQAMFDAAYNKITAANNKLNQVKDPDPNIASMMITFHKSIDDAMTHLDEQKEWLAKYFSKSKFGRSSMFTAYTWMGIPLN